MMKKNVTVGITCPDDEWCSVGTGIGMSCHVRKSKVIIASNDEKDGKAFLVTQRGKFTELTSGFIDENGVTKWAQDGRHGVFASFAPNQLTGCLKRAYIVWARGSKGTVEYHG
jgi:hypothetical protein